MALQPYITTTTHVSPDGTKVIYRQRCWERTKQEVKCLGLKEQFFRHELSPWVGNKGCVERNPGETVWMPGTRPGR